LATDNWYLFNWLPHRKIKITQRRSNDETPTVA
jgi:hypothetical protein